MAMTGPVVHEREGVKLEQRVLATGKCNAPLSGMHFETALL